MATSRILLIRRGDQMDRVPLAAGATTIGRATDNHVVLDDRDISHYHARITAIGDGLQITDLGSGHGTRVNHVALAPRISASIGDGDTVQVGAFTLTLQQNVPLGQAVTLVDIPRPSREMTVVETPLAPSPAPLDPAETVALHPSDLPMVAVNETLAQPVSLDLRHRERTLIGRLAANDLVLEHPTVSRFHARISRLDGAQYVEDLHAANGVFVNGERVSPEEAHPLRLGDTIHIGAVKLIFREDALEQIDESHDVSLDALHLNQPVGKGVNLLQDISLSICPREFVVVVGASGAGKSTLLNALTGFHPARSGRVLINGDNLYQNFDAHRANLGYVPQEDIIHADLTVQRALDYAAQLRLPADTSTAERKSRVEEVMTTLGLTERRGVPVRDLSGGQRKRVSIGVELLTKPGLFFLDEATSGLDPGTELQMMRLLRSLADDGQTVLLVTHATKNVALCDQVLFLAKGGHLAWYGPPDEALRYFGVDDFDAIYEKLEHDLTPAGWARRYRDSPQYQTYVIERLQQRSGPSLDP
ncbi:MAG: FHA domain-containing protein, partial [Dehalococcoidia bacterium]